MKDVLMWLFAIGCVGGALFLVEKVHDTAVSFHHWWLQRQWRAGFIAACEANNLQVEHLTNTHDYIRGALVQSGLKHGFNVALPRRYNPRAMDVLVRDIANHAGFDVPEREDG